MEIEGVVDMLGGVYLYAIVTLAVFSLWWVVVKWVVSRDPLRLRAFVIGALVCTGTLTLGLIGLESVATSWGLSEGEFGWRIWGNLTDVGRYQTSRNIPKTLLVNLLFNLLVIGLSLFFILVRIKERRLESESQGVQNIPEGRLAAGLALGASLVAIAFAVPLNLDTARPATAFVPTCLFFISTGLWFWRFQPAQREVDRPVDSLRPEVEEQAEAVFLIRSEWEQQMSQYVRLSSPRLYKVEASGESSAADPISTGWDHLVDIGYGSEERVPGFFSDLIKKLDGESETERANSVSLLAQPAGAGKSKAVCLAAIRMVRRGACVLIILPTSEFVRQAHGYFETTLKGLEHRGYILEDLESRSNEVEEPRGVYFASAGWISAHFLPKHREYEALIRGLEAVVYENLEAYSGMLGSDLWATSRRLGRSLDVYGVRPLYIATLSAQNMEGSDGKEFVGRLLGLDVRPVYGASARRARTLWMYSVIQAKANSLGQIGDLVHWTMEVGKRMVALDSRTRLKPEVREHLSVLHKNISHLSKSYRTSHVLVTEVRPENVLFLDEELKQLGSDTEAEEVYVMLLPSRSAFIRFLLRDNKLDTWRSAHPRDVRQLFFGSQNEHLIRRHVALSLWERPEAPERLKETFGRSEHVETAIRELEQLGSVSRRTQLELTPDGEQVEAQTYLHSRGLRPAIDSFETTSGERALRVVLRSDPNRSVVRYVPVERLALEAYEGCVFYSQGYMYRFQAWPSALIEFLDNKEAELDPGLALYCHREEGDLSTRPIRSIDIREIGIVSVPEWRVDGLPGAHPETIAKAEAQIELCLGVLGWVDSEGQYEKLSVPMGPPMKTFALLVDLLPQGARSLSRVGLEAIAVALEDVLRVYVGSREDDLLVVVLSPGQVCPHPVLAIVDAHEGGTGATEVLHRILRPALASVRDWLSGAQCCQGPGCRDCILPPHIEFEKRGFDVDRRAGAAILRGDFTDGPPTSHWDSERTIDFGDS